MAKIEIKGEVYETVEMCLDDFEDATDHIRALDGIYSAIKFNGDEMDTNTVDVKGMMHHGKHLLALALNGNADPAKRLTFEQLGQMITAKQAPHLQATVRLIYEECGVLIGAAPQGEAKGVGGNRAARRQEASSTGKKSARSSPKSSPTSAV